MKGKLLHIALQAACVLLRVGFEGKGAVTLARNPESRLEPSRLATSWQDGQRRLRKGCRWGSRRKSRIGLRPQEDERRGPWCAIYARNVGRDGSRLFVVLLWYSSTWADPGRRGCRSRTLRAVLEGNGKRSGRSFMLALPRAGQGIWY